MIKRKSRLLTTPGGVRLAPYTKHGTDLLNSNGSLVGNLRIPYTEQVVLDEEVCERVDHNPYVHGRINRTQGWKEFSHYKRVSELTPRESVLIDTGHTPYYLNASRGIYLRTQIDPAGTFWGNVNDDGSFGSPFQIGGLKPLVTRSAEGYDCVPPPTGLNTLLNSAFRTWNPSIKADVSLANSLFELKDMPSVLESARRLRSVTRILGVSLRALSLKKILQGRSMHQLTARLRQIGYITLAREAENFLQWKFNLSPLINDVQAVWKACRSVHSRLSRLEAHANKKRRRHYVAELYEPWMKDLYKQGNQFSMVIGDESVPIAFTSAASYRSTQEVTHVSCKFHAEIEYNYSLPRATAANQRLYAFLDSLGLSNDPSIIWNALPWSFVVDWVVNVSDYLEQLRASNLELRLNILRHLWSVKRERAFAHRLVSQTELDAPFDRVIPIAVVKEVAYTRRTPPAVTAWLKTSGLSPIEVTIGAHLAVARRYR